MLPSERLKKSNTAENLWIYVLALLKDKSAYGWEIPDLVEKKFGFRPGKITPYRVLYRLESEKFVASGVKNRRRIYSICPKGIRELNEAREFLLKIAAQINGKD